MTESTDAAKRRLKVAVLAWDVGHNPLGRAYMVAEALARHFEVVIVGFSFERYGEQIWPPLRNHAIPVVTVPGGEFPELWHRMRSLATRLAADAVVACKPRWPSLGLGLLMKAALDRPLILDIDDHELAFFPDAHALTLDEFLAAPETAEGHLPFGRGWTQVCETLTDLADQLIVSNAALQRRFGGHLVPHARDERAFDAAQLDRSGARARLGLSDDDTVVMFLGTPRPHKGVLQIAQAIASIDQTGLKFCVVGTFPEDSFQDQVQGAAPDRVVCVPDTSFADIPEVLVAADLVCLPQQAHSPISQYQLPAKIVDALMLGVPVLTSIVPPLQPLIDEGVVAVTDDRELEQGLRQMLDNLDAWRAKLSAKRDWIRDRHSYAAIGQTMRDLIIGELEAPRTQDDRIPTVLAQIDQAFPPPPPRAPRTASDQYEVTIFWKQNDSTLYGRRVDMLAKYLSRHPRVAHVVLFDAPQTIDYFERSLQRVANTHHLQLYERGFAKAWGLCSGDSLVQEGFIAAGPGPRDPLSRWRFPPLADHLEFVRQRLAQHFAGQGRSVVLGYPVHRELPMLIDALSPQLVVADVVDDQREWPGLSQTEIEERTRNYVAVCGRADLLLANCRAVQTAIERYAPRVELMPNACEVPELDVGVAMPVSLRSLPGPKIGYVGNLEAKIDLPLLRKLALALPDAHLVLIGSTHMNSAVLDLAEVPNIHLLGVIPYDEVSQYLAHFDVAIVPHLDSDQTRSMNPLKVYNYAAHGVPVVATNVHNIEDLAEHIVIASDHDGFIESVRQVVAAGRQPMSKALQATLQRHSWSKRVDRLVALLDRCWDERQAISFEESEFC